VVLLGVQEVRDIGVEHLASNRRDPRRRPNASSSIVVSNYTPQSSDGVTVPFDGNNHWSLQTGNCAQGTSGYDCAGNMTVTSARRDGSVEFGLQ
jgi:hypothetical protein